MVIIVIIVSLSFGALLLHWCAQWILVVPLILFLLHFIWLLFIHSVCADLLLKGYLLIIMDISLPIPILILLFKQVLALQLAQQFQVMFMLVLMPEQAFILWFILQLVLMDGFKFVFILVFIYYFFLHFHDLILFLL